MTGYAAAWRSMPRKQIAAFLTVAGAVALANLDQPFPKIAPLQHIPTILLIVAGPLLLRRWPLSNVGVWCVAAFVLLHTFAARWTYSNVPYDQWSRTLTGASVSEFLRTNRNEFDRLVHFSFGFLAIPAVSEAARRHAGMSARASIWTALLFVGAVSAIYEIIEWLLTLSVAPDLAADYNGQQGDPWDSQKDMAMALVGGFLASLALLRRGGP